jgi:hypothetical protein
MMTTGFRTHVYYSPPSPLGLLPGRWVVDHTAWSADAGLKPRNLSSTHSSTPSTPLAKRTTSSVLDRHRDVVHHRHVGAVGPRKWSHAIGETVVPSRWRATASIRWCKSRRA